jgi:hypothetical protein
LALKQQLVQLDGEDARDIWKQIRAAMPLFQLFKSDRPSTDQDSEAQDPMKAAVREALREKEAELGAVTAFVEELSWFSVKWNLGLLAIAS